MGANPVRGEVALRLGGAERVLRPTFAALVAAEDELGSLLQIVERAAAGDVRLKEMAGLFWHCLADRGPDAARGAFEDALFADGIAGLLPAYRQLLGRLFGDA